MTLRRWTPEPPDPAPFRFGPASNPLAHLTDGELLARARELRASLPPEDAARVEAEVRDRRGTP